MTLPVTWPVTRSGQARIDSPRGLLRPITLTITWPLVGTAIGCAAYVAAVQTGILNPAGPGLLLDLVSLSLLIPIVALGFYLGRARPLAGSLIGLALLIVTPLWHEGGFNPFPIILAFGAWLVGWLIRSHQELAAALEARASELTRERRRYAAEAVRYERSRIARELHDVVAHCMSIVVVQASAGQRLDDAADTHAVTDQMFDDIRELARQAETDLEGLTRLLTRASELDPGSSSEQNRLLSLEVIEQLVTPARAAGTLVDVAVDGESATIRPAAAGALHRVLQEGMTNAIKHAPGARVLVTLTTTHGSTVLEVRNAPAPASGPVAASLDRHGGGHGLRGLEDRIAALGGTLHARPTASGGWLLSATLTDQGAT